MGVPTGAFTVLIYRTFMVYDFPVKYTASFLFQQGIVIVDSPGVGESAIMDDIVKEYLPEAFAFIYVINSVNAGGIQNDRVG